MLIKQISLRPRDSALILFGELLIVFSTKVILLYLFYLMVQRCCLLHLFSDFLYGFRYSQSMTDLLTIVFDRISRAFNRSGAIQAVALDISKAFDRVRHAGVFHKLKSYGISGQIFALISSFLSNRQLLMVLDGKSSQEFAVNAGVPQGFVLGPALFLLYINDLPDDFICNIAIYSDDATLYSKFAARSVATN